MAEPQLHHVLCPDSVNGRGAGHRMAYWQWGNPQATQVVESVHGLTRQGRDFDVLAQAMGHAPTLIALEQVQAVLSFLFDSPSPQ